MPKKKLVKFAVSGKRSKIHQDNIVLFLDILVSIVSKGSCRTKDIMTEFELGERKALRMLKPFKRANIIIQDPYDRNKWILNPNKQNLKRVHVSDKQASILAWMYKLSKVFGTMISDLIFDCSDSLFRMEDTSFPFFMITARVKRPDIKLPFYENLYESIQKRNKILLTYVKEGADKQVTAWPIALVICDGMWYLGYLLELEKGKKQKVRTVRYQHIKDVKPLEEPFTRPDWVKTVLKEARNIWFNEKRDKKVVLEIDNSIKDYFMLTDYFPRQKITKEGPKTFRVETEICHNMEAIPTILRFMPSIRVVSPPALKKEIGNKIKAWLKR